MNRIKLLCLALCYVQFITLYANEPIEYDTVVADSSQNNLNEENVSIYIVDGTVVSKNFKTTIVGTVKNLPKFDSIPNAFVKSAIDSINRVDKLVHQQDQLLKKTEHLGNNNQTIELTSSHSKTPKLIWNSHLPQQSLILKRATDRSVILPSSAHFDKILREFNTSNRIQFMPWYAFEASGINKHEIIFQNLLKSEKFTTSLHRRPPPQTV